MKIYFAPMQGVTGWPYRLTHKKHYGGVDRYYMPFISVHQTRTMKGGEKRDLQPEHNEPCCMVPQLLAGSAQDSLVYMEMIREAGYEEVSLNFGCPARTVVTKRKGAGLLEDPAKLDAYLEHLFAGMTGRLGKMRVTVKTRIGMNDCSRTEELIGIYNRYPIAEVQVHARLGKDAYSGIPDMEAFRMFYDRSTHPVCYNGDIRSAQDIGRLLKEYPDLPAVMIGRGLAADPMLAEKIQTQEQPPETCPDCRSELQRLAAFHDDLVKSWYECYGQEHPVICRMLEVWDYLGASFPGSERKVRKIRKARDLDTYRRLAREVFLQEYRPGEWKGTFPAGH